MKLLPSTLVPRVATKHAPGRTSRESSTIVVTSGSSPPDQRSLTPSRVNSSLHLIVAVLIVIFPSLDIAPRRALQATNNEPRATDESMMRIHRKLGLAVRRCLVRWDAQ